MIGLTGFLGYTPRIKSLKISKTNERKKIGFFMCPVLIPYM